MKVFYVKQTAIDSCFNCPFAFKSTEYGYQCVLARDADPFHASRIWYQNIDGITKSCPKYKETVEE